MVDATAKTYRRRLRICFVVDKLAGRSGGAERILIEAANGLSGRGHEVQIISHEPREGAPFYPLALGVTHTNLRRPKAARSRLRRQADQLRDKFHRDARTYTFPAGQMLWWSKHGGFWRRLERHLAAHEPDVAVAFLPPAIVALGRARPSAGLRRIASLHNVPAQDLTNPARWDPNPVDRANRMQALANYDAITVLLPEFRDWFPEALRSRVAIQPNPVPPTSAAVRAKAQREKRVLSVGRLAGVKRHETLIDAWTLLAKEFPDWEAHIYGIGPSKNALAERIRDSGLEGKVRLMGHTDAIGPQYLAASIVCHPAEHEGWGLAVTEAMSAGVPAIGFADCPGVNQLIRHGKTGLLVGPGDDRTAALAEALAGLMRDPDRRAMLGDAGPERVAEFAPERILDLWEELLAGAEAPP